MPETALVTKYNDTQINAFCEVFVNTNDILAAGKALGIKSNIKERSLRLLDDPDIRQALLYKYNAITQVFSRERELVMNEFLNMTKFNIGDFASWEGTELTFKNSAELSEAEMQRICNVSRVVGRDGEVTLKVEFYDKMSVLDKVAKILGLYVDRHKIETVGNEGSFEHLSEEEREMAEAYARDVLAKRTDDDKVIDAECETTS